MLDLTSEYAACREATQSRISNCCNTAKRILRNVLSGLLGDEGDEGV